VGGVAVAFAVLAMAVSLVHAPAASAAVFPSVDAGGSHSCGVKSDATLACWGRNDSGQTAAPAGSFASVSAGSGHSCALRSDAALACWGSNFYGQTTAPAGSFASVSAGGGHSCALRSDAALACWGANFAGQTSAPAGTFRSVSAGDLHSCGLRSDASVGCWGPNTAGQTSAPAGSFASVSAGGKHSCAVRSDASVVCWGLNDFGQTSVPAGAFPAIKPVPPPPPPAADDAPPAISSLSLARRTFRVGPRPRGGSRRVRSGTAFRFTLSEAARVSFTIERATSGRRVRGRCRAPTPRNRRARRCTRYVRAGGFARQLALGRRRVSFSGRLRGRALRRGRYRVVIVARDGAGNRSRRHSAAFRVVR